MSEQETLDFLTALGEEFCTVLAPLVGWEFITPQDSYEVFLRALWEEPTPQLLASLSEAQWEEVRSHCVLFLECPGISVAHLRDVVGRTLARW